jgi:hypothetical protein
MPAMPKRLSEYSIADWRRLRPFTQGYKTVIDDAANAVYMRRAAIAGDLHAIRERIFGKRVLVTIAFSDPEAIAWQTALIRRYVRHDVHLVADNSLDDASSAEIRLIAERGGGDYLRLPRCPERASRGHGLALNWVWRNVIEPGRPASFGFLDDDLFPLATDDPFAPLGAQPFYGLVRYAGTRWYLWAGYCMFDFSVVRSKPLDFRQDWFIGLDTGGRNWGALYRHDILARLRQASFRQAPFKDGADPQTGYFQWCDGWLHEVGSNGNTELEREKRAVVAALVGPHLSREPQI